MLGALLRDLLRPAKVTAPPKSPHRRVLNVGGASKSIAIPSYFDGWEHLLLDIDRRGEPDIVCDARNLGSLEACQYDAIYCSHNLEHYYPHDGAIVLEGFLHLLKPDGFAQVNVPDIQAVMQFLVSTGMDVEETLYQAPSGPVSALDMIYGSRREIETLGNDFYAHKTGFTPTSLRSVLERAGFSTIFVSPAPELFGIRAFAFTSEPTSFHRELLGLPASAT